VCAQLHRGFETSWLVRELSPNLLGRTLTREEAQLVHRAVECLPADSRVLYAFSMLSRRPQALRLELYGLRVEEADRYLRRWLPRDCSARQTLSHLGPVRPLLHGTERPHLAFDITPDGVRSRLHFEGSFARLPPREPRWKDLFERWVGAGLADAEKVHGALAWSGYEAAKRSPRGWPQEAAGRPVPGFWARGLSHGKITCEESGSLEAKVYLLFQHLQRSGEASI
jgi:hypothetical protein